MSTSNFRQAAVQIAAAAAGALMILLSSPAQASYYDPLVAAYSTKTFTYNAWQGERLSVAISGDGDTDVDLRIRDPYGNVICSGLGPTDDESCTVYARRSGQYKVELINRGDVYNHVSLWFE